MSAPARSRQKAAPSTTTAAEEPGDQARDDDAERDLAAAEQAVDAEQAQPDVAPPAAEEQPPVEEPGTKTPADVAAEEATKAVAVRAGRGALGFDPDQRDLDGRQIAALAAIGIDASKDPDVGVHIRPFMHMCQVRDLDPYAREAYLIGRGKQGSKKWTMQVAIDGYLKIAGATGRYIGVKKLLWTGPGDDLARDFREVDGVMEPRWWGKWPASQGNPGAAKAVVAYYDEMGVEREMEAIADWEMYAPFTDLKVPDPSGAKWPEGKPKMVVKYGADGKPEQTLTDMWAKGAPHMLAKCALALCLRRAFPAKMSGMYLHEEMHRADAMERQRVAAEQARERREYVESMRASKRPANVPAEDAPAIGEANGVGSVLRTPSYPDSPSVIDGEVDDAPDRRPQQLGSILNEAMAKGAPAKPERAEEEPDVRGPRGADGGDPTEAERVEWLLDELSMMAEVVGSTPNALGRQWIASARKNLDAFTAAELQVRIASLRPLVISRMREEDGGTMRADAYEQVPPDVCGPVDWLLGLDLVATASA